MGSNLKYSSYGNWIVYFLVGRKCDFILNWSLIIQCRLQRVLQCFSFDARGSGKLNIKSFNPNGAVDWLGHWPNTNRNNMYLGDELACYIYVYCRSTLYSPVLRL